MTASRPTPVLSIRHVSVSYPARRNGLAGFLGATAPREVVHDVSLDIAEGETLGLVGESGCGKTTLARAVMGLVPVSAGAIQVGHQPDPRPPKPKTRNPKSETPKPRNPGNPESRHTGTAHLAQMVFQDPFSSLNPRLTVLELLSEAPVVHGLWPRAERRERARALLADVGLPPDILLRYPHAFSGGQRQRLNIARALALEPRLLVCDEPVSALDVSVQAQVLNLLVDLQRRRGLAMLFITHDLAVVRHVADRVAVMQEGRIVEEGPADRVLSAPEHPYTRKLLDACLD